MKREDLISSDLYYIENFVQRVECRLGFGYCHSIHAVWNQGEFTRKQLKDAYYADKSEVRGLAQDLLALT